MINSAKRPLTASVLVLAASWCSASVAAVFVTPGSLAGYTYFPQKSSGNGSTGDDYGRTEVLQKCIVAIKKPDVTFSFNESDFYGLKSIRLYYKAAGGNGGGGPNGGGGGSTAILINGAPVVIANGADGSSVPDGKYGGGTNGGIAVHGGNSKDSEMVQGEVNVSPGDTVRFITGGGGGSGSPAAGGGGGAGWRGGGAGSSDAPGKGGGSVPGLGGYGSNPGTSGIGHNGGVSTFPDASSAPLGDSARQGGFLQRGPVSGGEDSVAGYWRSLDARIASTPTRSGSLGVPFPFTVHQAGREDSAPGFGGAWGFAGSPAPSVTWMRPHDQNFNLANNIKAQNSKLIIPRCEGWNCASITTTYSLADVSNFESPDTFELTRKQVQVNTSNAGTYGVSNLPGQIVLMYSAVECVFLK